MNKTPRKEIYMPLPRWTRRVAAVLAAVLLTVGSASMLIGDAVFHSPDLYRCAAVPVIIGFGVLMAMCCNPTHTTIERTRQAAYDAGYEDGCSVRALARRSSFSLIRSAHQLGQQGDVGRGPDRVGRGVAAE